MSPINKEKRWAKRLANIISAGNHELLLRKCERREPLLSLVLPGSLLKLPFQGPHSASLFELPLTFKTRHPLISRLQHNCCLFTIAARASARGGSQQNRKSRQGQGKGQARDRIPPHHSSRHQQPKRATPMSHRCRNECQ